MNNALHFSITGIGLIGPGWNHWNDAQATLSAPGADWAHTPTVIPAPTCLPPAERRRAGSLVRLALSVAEQACADSGLDVSQLSTVFSTSSGEPENCHKLCETLASDDRQLSPTRFTNSVHNAAAGYWHIAQRSMAPSTSLCGFEASWGAGLLEAAVQCVSAKRPVLMVSVDVPYPEPLHGVRPLPQALGLALLLQPSAAPGALRLSLKAAPTQITPCEHSQLERMRRASPVGRALPLLQRLASPTAAAAATELYLDYLEGLALHLEMGGCDD